MRTRPPEIHHRAWVVASTKAGPSPAAAAAPPGSPVPPTTPKKATDDRPRPSAMPSWPVVLKMPEADPECSAGTSEIAASVIGATIRPIPAPISSIAGAICQDCRAVL